MRSFIVIGFLFSLATAGFAWDKTGVVDFKGETVGAPGKSFSSFVGSWYVAKDGKNIVYAVDGRKWSRGAMSAGIADKAKALYGERYAEFLDNLALFPQAKKKIVALQ